MVVQTKLAELVAHVEILTVRVVLPALFSKVTWAESVNAEIVLERDWINPPEAVPASHTAITLPTSPLENVPLAQVSVGLPLDMEQPELLVIPSPSALPSFLPPKVPTDMVIPLPTVLP